MYNGIINVYKEAGFTSHDVVAKLRGILKQKKIGHTGTLDPDAVGVLPVCLGNGTKLCDMLTNKSKEYRAVFLLGKETDTQDISGKVLTEKDVRVSVAEVIDAILSFEGEYDQIPPMYSAIKVGGKRLYQLAREGIEIERKARRVQIDFINIEKIDLPEVLITVGCSKGTYIRTLCHDIGQRLECGAVMTHLERTRVGDFHIEDAIVLSEIENIKINGRLEDKITPVETFFLSYRKITVSPQFRKLIENGNTFYLNMTEDKEKYEDKEQVRVYSDEGKFFGIFDFHSQEEKFKPVKIFMEK